MTDLPDITVPLRAIGRDPGLITQQLIMAFNGWGYNWYKATNRQRADDLLVRAKAQEILSRVAGFIAEATHKLAGSIPAPSRADPLPGRDIMPHVKAWRGVCEKIGSLAGRIGAAPAPGRDRIFDRHRDEGATLAKLQGFDLYALQLIMNLEAKLAGLTPADLKDAALLQGTEAELQAIRRLLDERADFLAL
ncbi:MAG: hypothetical protein B7Z78_11120 [Rhodospirillales bacterium 20-60-12]|nr:MAG: hypothetical protein B7Z78_11120 [Rhodospirillales bacterium 20-60-12]HQT67232.1 hypothetical protein [Acetobacteraceae bacterium]HQU01101.1 hypothetical protein [Acetobacteraceae bacterium]